MFLNLPLTFTRNLDGSRSDADAALSDALLVTEGPITGFRVEDDSLLVQVDVNAWLLADLGQPRVEAVTAFVQDALDRL